MTKEEIIKDYMEFMKILRTGANVFPQNANDKYMDLLYELVSDTFKFEINNVKDAYNKSSITGDDYVAKLIGNHPVDLISSCSWSKEYMQFLKDNYNDLEDVWNILAEICDGIAVEANKAYKEVAEKTHKDLVDKGLIEDKIELSTAYGVVGDNND